MKKLKILFITLGTALCIYLFMGILAANNMFDAPRVPKADLMPILQKTTFTDEDYAILFEQTGLAAPIIDELMARTDFVTEVLSFQESYFREVDVQKTNMNLITRIDKAFDADGAREPVFKMAPYRNGYIFLTKSTYTGNWRHGHAGLVTDAVRGKVLESLEPGTVTVEQNVGNWLYYPTFKMMRLKDTPQEKLDEIALFAQENLLGIPYNILTMKNHVDTYKRTHCSFIVWQAFEAFGIDLDTTGGIFVSPQDIAASPYLETLQIFGFDPERVW